VDFIIAPMVETPYALGKYAAAIAKVFPSDERSDIRFLVNVETCSTFEKLDEIAAIAGEQSIGLVFGRVDFAGSLGHDRSFVNTPEMMSYVLRTAEMAELHGVDLVVGGGVSPESVEPLRRVRATKLNRFETRKVIFDAGILDTNDVEAGLAAAIEFELLWLKNKRDYYVGIGAEDEKRIAMMENRQQVKISAAA